MVLVDTPPDTCRQWNDERRSDPASTAPPPPTGGAMAFAPAIFADLACRFERPDSRNRWDSPLFTLRPLLLGPADLREQLEAIAAAVAPPPSKQLQQQRQQRRRDEAAAAEATAAAAGDAAGGQPSASTEASGAETAVATAAAAAAGEPPLDVPPPVLQAYKELKPHVATSTVGSTLSATNLQSEIDAALQHVLQRMAEAQAAAGSGAPGIVCFGPAPAPGDASGGGVGGSIARLSSNGGSSLPPLDMYRPVSVCAAGQPERCCVRVGTPLACHRPCANLATTTTAACTAPVPPLQMFLPELRRHKRAFMKLATNQTFTRVRDAAAAQRMFLAYLRDQLAAAGA